MLLLEDNTSNTSVGEGVSDLDRLHISVLYFWLSKGGQCGS